MNKAIRLARHARDAAEPATVTVWYLSDLGKLALTAGNIDKRVLPRMLDDIRSGLDMAGIARAEDGVVAEQYAGIVLDADEDDMPTVEQMVRELAKGWGEIRLEAQTIEYASI